MAEGQRVVVETATEDDLAGPGPRGRAAAADVAASRSPEPGAAALAPVRTPT
jgi:hypothetical protein